MEFCVWAIAETVLNPDMWGFNSKQYTYEQLYQSIRGVMKISFRKQPPPSSAITYSVSVKLCDRVLSFLGYIHSYITMCRDTHLIMSDVVMVTQ